MEQDKHKTKVIFKKWPEGDLIALFPELKNYPEDYYIESYSRIGQHGAAHKDLIKDLKDAKVPEYNFLYNELTDLGYNLDVIKEPSTFICSICGKPAQEKDVGKLLVVYYHHTGETIGSFVLMDSCLQIRPTKEELEKE